MIDGMRFQLTAEQNASAVSLLAKFGYTGKNEIARIQNNLIDYYSAAQHCIMDIDYPLLENSDLYYQHEEQVLFAKVLKIRLEELDNAEDYSHSPICFEHSWEGDEFCTQEDINVFSGLYVISAFKSEIFSIDFKQFGFQTFEDCIFVTGAYILNTAKSPYYDNLYQWESKHDNGDVFLNRFEKNINGDFRFYQYHMNPSKGISPFNDIINFSLQKRKSLHGYHSVECSFLATILRYAIQSGIKPSAFKDYDGYVQGMLSEGQRHGNFSDSGCKTWFIEAHLLDDEIPPIDRKIGSKLPTRHIIHKEASGHHSAYIENTNLVFLPTNVKFTVSDINNLVDGIHNYCVSGACRTTVKNLYDLYKHIKEETKSLLRDSELLQNPATDAASSNMNKS